MFLWKHEKIHTWGKNTYIYIHGEKRHFRPQNSNMIKSTAYSHGPVSLVSTGLLSGIQ